MIGLIWLNLAWAELPADPGCGLGSCPTGQEARTCRDDFEGNGDCFSLQADGWERACMLHNWDKAWEFVVCRPLGPLPPDWRQGDPGCGLSSCPPGHEVQTCGDWFNQDGDCTRLDGQGWQKACTLADRDKSWTLVMCRAPPGPPPAPPQEAGCGVGCDAVGGAASGVWPAALLALVRPRRSTKPRP